MGAVVMVLTLDRQLTKHLLAQPAQGSRLPVPGPGRAHQLHGAEHYGGDHIIYCGDYLEPDHEYFQLSKEELLERFLPSLTRFNPQFERSWVKETLAVEDRLRPAGPAGQPLAATSRAIRTPVPGLYFASMSQVYPWDRGTNFAVEIGRRVAKMVMEDLAG